MTQADRLNLLLAQKNLTHADLALAIGVSRQAVQKWASGRSAPKGTNLAKICQFFDVTTEWMTRGEDHLQQVLKVESVGSYHEDDPTPDGYVAIPEYRITFGAGSDEPPTIEEEQNSRKALYRQDFFDAHGVKAENCKRYKVHGDSMQPTLNDGDTVLVVENPERIVDGDVYVFSVRNEMMIKRLYRRANGTIVIHSDNEDGRYIDEEMTPEDQEREYFRVYGHAIERSGAL